MSSKNFQTKLLDLQSNLLNFAYLLTSNRDDAYDLLQDTTLKALDNEDKYVDNVNFKGWVFTIMRNIFINNYRKVVRSATVIDQTEDLYHPFVFDVLSIVYPISLITNSPLLFLSSINSHPQISST